VGGLGGGPLLGSAGGKSSLIEIVATGAATMKMIRSTSMTSTKGVTFISALVATVNFDPLAGPES
jgi:hypothetical protein